MSSGTHPAEGSSQIVKAAPVLTECSERAVACRLHLLHSGHVCDAAFHKSQAGRVVLHTTPAAADEALQPEALCCVAFPFQQSLYAFMTCIKKVRDGETALEVHFEQPATLTVTNLRQSYRVPVVRESNAELTLRLSDGTRIRGELLNISESGFELNLSTDDERLAIDTEVNCELRFRNENIEIPAMIRRRQQSRRAVQFTLVRSPESRPTFLAVQRLVRSLEQIWLKSRAGSQTRLL